MSASLNFTKMLGIAKSTIVEDENGAVASIAAICENHFRSSLRFLFYNKCRPLVITTDDPDHYLICAPDQLIMTWDNGMDGWKKAKDIRPFAEPSDASKSDAARQTTLGGDRLMALPRLEDRETKNWVPNNVVACLQATAEVEMYKCDFAGDGVDIGPEAFGRPDTFIANGLVCHC